VSPSDINDIQRTYSGTPSSISSATIYGGGASLRFARRWMFTGQYSLTNAKNLSSAGTGIEINQSAVWGSLSYYLIHGGRFNVYLGAGAGLPTWTQAVSKTSSSSTTNYTADNKMGYMGELGLEFVLGNHVRLFFEGDYIVSTSGDLKSPSGSILRKANNTGNASVDLSGFYGIGGLSILF
jgi:outer membrane protein W